MNCNFPPKKSFQYLSTRRGTNRSRLEHLFGSRLSYLNIEDEYNYNLSYLVSQNINGSKWASTLGLESKSPVSRTKLECIDSRNESSRSRDLQTPNIKKQPQFTSEKPTKQVAEDRTISKSQKLKTSITFTGMTNKGTPVLPTVTSAATKEQEKNKSVRQKPVKNESTKADRVQQPRKTVTTNHQPSESQFPGLHIYVTDSPQRPYYDMMSSYEPPTPLFSRKTVASDPIILNISNGSKHKRSITHNTYQNEPGFKSNYQTPPDTPSAVDHSHIPTVASRIEKFTALIKNNDDTLFVNLSRARSPYRDNENSVQSQDENINGSKWASTLGLESKSPVSRTKLECIDSRNESSRSRDLQTPNIKKQPQFTSEKPTKQVAEDRTISKSQKLKTSITFTGMTNKGTPVLPTVTSAATKEQEKNKSVRQKPVKNESTKADRVQQPRKTVTTNHQPSESQFPGLHIYVTDSPQRPYYDMMSSYEPPTPLFSRKTVASDPIILNISNGSKHKRSITHNTYQNEPGFKSNYQTPPDTPSAVDHSHIPTVASRIEKFTALIKNNDDTLFVNLSRARSPYRDNENSVQSQDETIDSWQYQEQVSNFAFFQIL
ncbi:hypothetical protein AHF37_07469 [Paragonimus kellicotti]|nr:hypothetical protein AHF37_07469 [Paragonimus kellicotti]